MLGEITLRVTRSLVVTDTRWDWSNKSVDFTKKCLAPAIPVALGGNRPRRKNSDFKNQPGVGWISSVYFAEECHCYCSSSKCGDPTMLEGYGL